MRALRIIVGFFAVLGIALLSSCSPTKPQFSGTDVTGVPWGGDVALTSHKGEPRKLSDFRGKVIALFFGFSRCPDICTPTMAKLAAAVRELGDKGTDVQVIMITVDPEHDTPAVLEKFVSTFHPSFVGMTGSIGQIVSAQREFKIVAEGQRQGVVMHSGQIMLKGRDGRLRVILNNEAPVSDIAHDMALLVAQR